MNARVGFCLVVALAGSPLSPARAQSAADRATARGLATQGIELEGSGKYAEALDKLERAQALYDAPVHLLHIARVQAKLGLFVEASESYRRLARSELTAASPKVARDALDAGKREAPEVEKKIGALRIGVRPTPAELELTLDGQALSSAVLGVDRPTNPGQHVLRASSPGYRAAVVRVETLPGERKSVELELIPDPAESPAPSEDRPASQKGGDAENASSAEVPSAQARSVAGAASVAEDARAEPHGAPPRARLSLVFGARVGAAVPGGTLYQGNGLEVDASDYVKTGGVLELNAGVWFAEYFGAKLFVEGGLFGAGQRLDDLAEFISLPSSVTSRVSQRAIGLSLQAGTPLGRIGAAGEVGVLFGQEMHVTRTFQVTESPSSTSPCGEKFEQKLDFQGPGLRLGASMRIPLGQNFQLSPYLLATFAQTNNVTNQSACRVLTVSDSWPRGGNPPQTSVYRLVVLGIGGDLLLGL